MRLTRGFLYTKKDRCGYQSIHKQLMEHINAIRSILYKQGLGQARPSKSLVQIVPWKNLAPRRHFLSILGAPSGGAVTEGD